MFFSSKNWLNILCVCVFNHSYERYGDLWFLFNHYISIFKWILSQYFVSNDDFHFRLGHFSFKFTYFIGSFISFSLYLSSFQILTINLSYFLNKCVFCFYVLCGLIFCLVARLEKFLINWCLFFTRSIWNAVFFSSLCFVFHTIFFCVWNTFHFSTGSSKMSFHLRFFFNALHENDWKMKLQLNRWFEWDFRTVWHVVCFLFFFWVNFSSF